MKLSGDFKKRIFSRLKILLLVCAAYYLITWFTGCPIQYFLGISCPGCGMTRAWMAVLHLDFAQAFACHPLFLLAPLFAAVFLLEEWIDFRKYRWAVVLTAVLFFLIYFVRIIWFPSDIVFFRPSEGHIYQIFSGIRQILTGLL